MLDATAVPHTLELWLDHLHRKVPRPVTLTAAELKRLSSQEKARYDHERRIYLGSEHVLKTNDWWEAQETLQTLRDVNLGHRPTARQALLMSGPQRSGKSTIALNLLRIIDREIREREGREGDRTFAPTLALVAPDEGTTRKLMERFAYFLNVPYNARDNAEVITNKVGTFLAEMGTEVIFLDEVQNLRTSSTSGTVAGSAIKGFMERLPITWYFSGVDVMNEQGEQTLFTGRLGEQMKGRIVPREMTRYGIRSEGDRKVWCELITHAEALLPLANHKPGSLAESSWAWLHDHTGGSPGPLWDILHNAATRAIRDGSEEVMASHLSEKWISAADLARVRESSAQTRMRRAPRESIVVDTPTEQARDAG